MLKVVSPKQIAASLTELCSPRVIAGVDDAANEEDVRVAGVLAGPVDAVAQPSNSRPRFFC